MQNVISDLREINAADGMLIEAGNLEELYETGETDPKGVDGRSGCVGRGLAVAAWLLWHMYHHLDIALDLDEKHAGRHMQASSMKRFLVMAVVLAVTMTQYRYVHPIGTVLGMFGMKISAFMQPKIHKLMTAHK